jgi:hypothetical protein
VPCQHHDGITNASVTTALAARAAIGGLTIPCRRGYGCVGRGQAERCGGFEIDLSQYGLIDSAEYDDSK